MSTSEGSEPSVGGRGGRRWYAPWALNRLTCWRLLWPQKSNCIFAALLAAGTFSRGLSLAKYYRECRPRASHEVTTKVRMYGNLNCNRGSLQDCSNIIVWFVARRKNVWLVAIMSCRLFTERRICCTLLLFSTRWSRFCRATHKITILNSIHFKSPNRLPHSYATTIVH